MTDYNHFDASVPVITGTRQNNWDNTRYNLTALRDAITGGLGMPGFDYSYSGGTADQPDIMYFKDGNTWIRLEMTWGTTGGEEGNPTQVDVSLSTDGGSNWEDTWASLALTWDANGYLTSTTWTEA